MQEDGLVGACLHGKAFCSTSRPHRQARHLVDILAPLLEPVHLRLHALHTRPVHVSVAWMVDLPRARELQRVIWAILLRHVLALAEKIWVLCLKQRLERASLVCIVCIGREQSPKGKAVLLQCSMSLLLQVSLLGWFAACWCRCSSMLRLVPD